MTKKTGSRVGSVFSNMFNIKQWFDWPRVSAGTTYIGTVIKRFFVPQSPAKEESFKQATKRLHLKEGDLELQQRSLLRLSKLMAFLACCIFIYALYLLIHAMFIGTLVSLVIMMLAWAMAFRYHFWYFQMKSQRLGCSFQEWFRLGLLGEKK